MVKLYLIKEKIEIIIVHCIVANSDYQVDSRVLCPLVSNLSFG